ncbi:MAG: twin-arginine translocation signal domain-containing protein [Anaerolineales bacterium]|nr:twin-arginine translocation signal domain-containing protein [Anaerolineales bacterium]
MTTERSKSNRVSRREFLRLAALATGSVAVGGYLPQVATAAAGTPPPLAPTATGVAPAIAALQADDLGGLVGKLEGPTIILDVAEFPKTFAEAPMLAELVEAGDLPAVEERLPGPEDVMVIQPLAEIGQYGGTWRRAFTGPADHENGNRINSNDKILHFDYTGSKIVPALAKGWEVSEDGTTITIFLRQGAKWSDGQPLTADDFMFWYEDIYSNPEIVPTPFPEMQINGQPGVMKKIDDFTIAFEFPEAYPYFTYVLAGSTGIGAGFATRGAFGTFGGGYCPAHYLKQFLPKYSSEEEVTQMATDEGFDSWLSLLKNRYSWALNPDLPTMTPWRTTSPINTPTWTMERNPYFWAVDTEGNQLPYIDKITMTLAENVEVANLRAIAGEYDVQERHMGLDKLPVSWKRRKR